MAVELFATLTVAVLFGCVAGWESGNKNLEHKTKRNANANSNSNASDPSDVSETKRKHADREREREKVLRKCWGRMAQ